MCWRITVYFVRSFFTVHPALILCSGSIISCNTDAIPQGATVVSAVVTLKTSMVYGGNPFVGNNSATIQIDMVRVRTCPCCPLFYCSSHFTPFGDDPNTRRARWLLAASET